MSASRKKEGGLSRSVMIVFGILLGVVLFQISGMPMIVGLFSLYIRSLLKLLHSPGVRESFIVGVFIRDFESFVLGLLHLCRRVAGVGG